jgi:hypothetical protein
MLYTALCEEVAVNCPNILDEYFATAGTSADYNSTGREFSSTRSVASLAGNDNACFGEISEAP